MPLRTSTLPAIILLSGLFSSPVVVRVLKAQAGDGGLGGLGLGLGLEDAMDWRDEVGVVWSED